MKNKLGIFSLSSAIMFCAICWMQSRQNQTLKRELATLRQTLEERDRQKQADDARNQELLEQHETLTREAARLAGELQTRRTDSTARSPQNQPGARPDTEARAADNEKGAFGDMLKKMLDDPDMKKMMRQQQTAMLDSMYGPLFKQLGLSSEEVEKLKELLIDNQMKGVENAGLFFNHEVDPAKRQEAAQAMAEEHKQGGEQLKAFLGEERYAQYKDYQETLGERMALNQFKEQLAGGQNALTDDQAGQLLAIMKEEEKSVPAIFNTDPGATPDFSQFESMLSEERMEQHFQRQEELNARILERAKAVLSPEQFATFGGFQSNQLQMQRFGMTMAIKFMGGKKSEETAPANRGP